MRRRTARRRLRSYFLAVAIASAFIPALVLGAGGALALRALSASYSDALGAVFLQSLADRVESFLERASRALRYAAVVEARSGGGGAIRYLAAFFPEFDMIQMLSAEGRILEIAPYDERFVGMDMAGQAAYRDEVRTNGVALSQGFVSIYSGNPTVTLSVNLADRRIVGFLSLAELSGALARAGLPEGALGLIVDARGVVIAHPDYRKAVERATLDPVELRAIAERSGGGEIEIEGERYRAHFARLGASGWYVGLARTPKSARGVGSEFLAIFALVFAASIGFGVITALRGVAAVEAGLSRLVAAAGRVAAAPIESVSSSEGEFEELGRAVAAFEEMERRVAEREDAMREAEERLKRSLAEKDVLLKEVHHRVKNNLQVVSSILRLQAGAVEDERVAALFLECQNRVQAMALVHEQLYRSDTIAAIGMRGYLESLVAVLSDGFDPGARGIRITCDIAERELPTALAVPCGLIAVELLTNALKYAYPQGLGGAIRIRFEDRRESCALVVEDEGRGLPPGFEPGASRSLGLSLVTSLVGQLRGELSVEGPPGARFVIRFVP